tara:strand:+ start:56 stop:982 length:927 start_codon:yes stop_codon:yes gene_type:complete
MLANKVAITGMGGVHRKFITYFLDRFSLITPEIKQLPFNLDTGTSHRKDIPFSGFFVHTHILEKEPYFERPELLNIIIKVDIKNLLFLERIVHIRAGDLNQKLNNNLINFNKDYLDQFNGMDIISPAFKDKIKMLYNIEINEKTDVPKFVIRDLLKLGFIDPTKNGYIVHQNKTLKHLPKNYYWLSLTSIWDKNSFFATMEEISNRFNLQLNLNSEAEEVYDLFLNNIQQYKTFNRIDDIIKALKNKNNMDISDIDVVEQAYLSAYIEKNFNIRVPVSNYFFNTTKEILTWIKWFPTYIKKENSLVNN